MQDMDNFAELAQKCPIYHQQLYYTHDVSPLLLR